MEGYHPFVRPWRVIVALAASVVVGCSMHSAVNAPAQDAARRSLEVHPSQSGSAAIVVPLPALNLLAFVNPSTLTIRSLVPVPGGPTTVKIQPSHTNVAMNVNGGAALQLLDFSNEQLGRSISVPAGFTSFVFNNDGSMIYTINVGGTITVLASESGVVVKTINVGAETRGIAYSQKYHRIYASMPDSNSIVVYDAGTFAQKRSISAGSCPPAHGHYNPCRPYDLATSADGSYLLAAASHGQIVAIDGLRGTQLAVMGGPEHLAPRHIVFQTINPKNGELLLLDAGCCIQEVYEVPTSPPFSGETLLTRAGPYQEMFVGAAFDPKSGKPYGARRGYPPSYGKVVRIPSVAGVKQLVLGTAPGGFAFTP